MGNHAAGSQVQIRPWSEDHLHLELLYRLNAPEMLEHLGGPESDEQVEKRHKRYVEVQSLGNGCMYSIWLADHPVPIGNAGFWESGWQGSTIYEIGWGVLPSFQQRGIASAATAAVIEQAKQQEKHRFMHAFPSVDNPGSNAICRKLGFAFMGECDFEYPKGSFMHCNDWRLDLESGL
ncbi:GNAT family N-acetyltransferase [Paenibacillus cellulositrophicus]|uniref:GNAT family N-acetyltransferase n=1 Tax=Paenibacillus cellulositrophicus TaxID=562959 RepID=UPI003F81722A